VDDPKSDKKFVIRVPFLGQTVKEVTALFIASRRVKMSHRISNPSLVGSFLFSSISSRSLRDTRHPHPHPRPPLLPSVQIFGGDVRGIHSTYGEKVRDQVRKNARDADGKPTKSSGNGT